MKKYLVTVLVWMLTKLRAFPVGDAQLLVRMRELVVEAQKLAVSGERRRSFVINRVKAEFPNMRVRDLAFLLERIVQEFE